MNIAPLPTGRPREISVTVPMDAAFERVKQMLFRPFDLGKWFTIGFCAWLAGLGETGGGFHGGYGSNTNFNNNSGSAHLLDDFRQFYYHARDYVLANINWILPLAAIVVIGLLALWVLILWLSSRGKFMFLHCVALDRAEIELPWTKFAAAADSLFWFRLGVGLLGLVLMLPLLVLMLASILQMVLQGQADLARVMTVLGLGVIFFLLSFLFGLVHKFTMDFVVPLMFLRGGGCLAAWGEFYRLFVANFWRFILYLLFQIVLGMLIGMIVLMAVLVTCCVAGCVMLLPYLGTVLLLPVLVFKRAYPLIYLAQYGPQYDVFPPPPIPPIPPGSPLAPV